jgi:hypothetical protein
MKRRLIAEVCLLAVCAVLAMAVAAGAHAQRHKVGVVHNLEATAEKGVAHPATFTLTGTGTITCVRAFSDVMNPNPVPACKIAANGFNGTMAVNSNATLKAGDITLTCTGPGVMLRCDARVDITPPAQ